MTHYRTSVRRRWYKKAPDDAGALNLLEAGSQSCLADACTDGKARETGARCAFRWFCRALLSSIKLGGIRTSSRVDGDRAVRPRSSSAYNGRIRLTRRRRVPVA